MTSLAAALVAPTRPAPALACAVAALALCGCYSSFPLDEAPQAPLDRELLGSWRCLPPDPEPDAAAATLHFAEARDGVYGVRFKADDDKAPSLFEAHVSRVGEQAIFNVKLLDARASKPWLYARYAFLRPHVLELQYLDEDAFEAVEPSPQAFRRVVEQLAVGSPLWKDFAVCVRTNAP